MGISWSHLAVPSCLPHRQASIPSPSVSIGRCLKNCYSYAGSGPGGPHPHPGSREGRTSPWLLKGTAHVCTHTQVHFSLEYLLENIEGCISFLCSFDIHVNFFQSLNKPFTSSSAQECPEAISLKDKHPRRQGPCLPDSMGVSEAPAWLVIETEVSSFPWIRASREGKWPLSEAKLG